jgi:transposase InsO family protein
MIKEKQISITRACTTLELSRDSYYKWKNKEVQTDDSEILRTIKEIAEEFPFYGYRRITKEMQNRGFCINHKKILGIMKENNIICRRKKRFKPVTTQSNHDYDIYPNLIENIKITGLNQVWVSDITYVHLLDDFVYLATIIDIFSRKCVGWNLSRNINTFLTLGALKKAIASRKNIGFSNLIHHSDQGVQYAADEYTQRLEEFGINISMSRKGEVYDNAFAESFMKTIKVEEVYINDYETFEDVLKNIKHFIEKVYNAKRLHSGIGYKSPNKFEQEVLKTTLT